MPVRAAVASVELCSGGIRDKSIFKLASRWREMKIGSLFSGIGALDLAVESVTGGAVVWHSEVDPYASAVLRRHWPSVPNLGDIYGVTHPPYVNVMCGGFPCQDISSAGRRQGIGGKKSKTWEEFARIIREVGPDIVFVENVAALRRRGLDVVLGDLAALGFDAEWTSITAAEVGAPHRRDRMFVLAYRDRNTLRKLSKRRKFDPAKRENGFARHLGPKLAHALHDGSGFRRASHYQAGSDARWDDPYGRDEGVVFPPKPDDADAWVAWAKRGGPVPGVRRVAYGDPQGLDARSRRRRLRHLGNGVVPRQAAAAFLMLESFAIGAADGEAMAPAVEKKLESK